MPGGGDFCKTDAAADAASLGYHALARASRLPTLPFGDTPMTPLLSLALLACCADTLAADPWVVYPGGEGAGKGKHLVLIAGDDEYHSEEAMPQLGKILAKHHGFKVTVLFAINKKDGTIDPSTKDNIPGLEALAKADLMVMFLRFRDLPDEQMKLIFDYVESGKPIVGLRTSTHAFSLNRKSKYHDWTYDGKGGGFGRKVLGETWVAHHGGHGSEATRGILTKDGKDHPILKGIKDGDIFGPTDVYTVKIPLPGDSKPLVLGQVVAGMKPSDPPVKGKKNDPMMPLAWTKTYTPKDKETKARIFCTTMGSSEDLESEGFRRLLVNACYWGVGLEEKIPDKSAVDLVGKYTATSFKKPFVKGVKPEAHAMK
jgi:Trehalose utilisation